MKLKGSHSSSFILLFVMVEDPASDLHPILFNRAPSVSTVASTCVLLLFIKKILGKLLIC